MIVWLITVGEPLPTDPAGNRLLRTGLLAEHLAARGHSVVWWTSQFDHVRKQHRPAAESTQWLAPNYRLVQIPARGYRRNTSVARLYDHYLLARRFQQLVDHEARPDVILCSWPTLELCVSAARYGRRCGVPVVLDVRDLWPDALVDLMPGPFRWMFRWAAQPFYRLAREAARHSAGITGITEDCVQWAREVTGTPPSLGDRAFPLAYQERPPTESAQREALAFWNSQGIRADGSFTACYFGTFGANKVEISTVLSAARILRQHHIPARFVLCGAPQDVAVWRRKATDLPNVLFPGWVNGAQIWSLMRLSAVGLAPYRSIADFRRSIPNKPIEYMSAGLPVVSSLQGVLANTLDQWQAGITYPNQAAPALAAHLERLFTAPPLRAKLARNARALFQERFVAERVYREMADYVLSFATPTAVQQAA